MDKKEHSDHISRIMNDPEQVRLIIQSAINDALLKHKQAGNPVCTVRNGKIHWIQPEDIVINEAKQDLDN